MDLRLGSKYTADGFPKNISLTYYSDRLYLLELENMYLDFQNRNLKFFFFLQTKIELAYKKPAVCAALSNINFYHVSDYTDFWL